MISSVRPSYAEIPQWQIDAVRESKAYYQQHPEELMDWVDAKKLITMEMQKNEAPIIN